MSTSFLSTEPLGARLRKLRLERKLPLRKVAALLDIDVAILSKMERGERKITKEALLKLAEIYDCPTKELLITFLRDKVLYEIAEESYALEALEAAESAIEYRRQNKPSSDFENLSKAKLIDILSHYFSSQTLISKAYLFGSFARGEENPSSDIDIAIEIHSNKSFTFFDLMDVQEDLQKLTSRRVDVVTINSFRPNIRNRFEKDKITIYEA